MATSANVPIIASGHKASVSIVLIVAATYWGSGFSKVLLVSVVGQAVW